MADAGTTERDSGIDLEAGGGMADVHPRAVRALRRTAAAGRVTLEADPSGAGDVGRGGLPPAGDASAVSAVRGVNVDAVMRTLLARGLITEAGTDPDTGAVTFASTELFLERLGLASLADLPDIAPLLPDVDMIDEI